ncbi:hypothetical protein KQX54_004472 [Cotesia glomerata]|uniref:Uncharacterized protein n=1 Tax=Cotesia glomerata TaxID=32391 RepID=A0AAV7J3C9_COTGL|nr:hypothetical protein KQX54_004472 [Cotesia glomerata]
MLLCLPAIACPPALPDHRYFLTKLPESQINTLALIGSHDSATYNTLTLAAQTQQRSITEQLNAARGNNDFGLCAVSLHCDQQNLWKITSTFTRTAKWNAISAFQDKIFNANSSESCYINYLSPHGGIIGPNTIANKFWSDILEFSGTGLRPGMNYRMIKYFRNIKNTLYIVMVDNPLPQLLDKIVISNYER